MAQEKVILYSYVKPVNKKFIEKLSLKTNHSASACLDAVIDAVRRKRELTLKEKPLKSLEKIQKAKEKRKEKIRALG